MYVVTAAEMRRLDHLTIHAHGVPSLTLMERAGQGVVDVILKRWAQVGQARCAGGGGQGKQRRRRAGDRAAAERAGVPVRGGVRRPGAGAVAGRRGQPRPLSLGGRDLHGDTSRRRREPRPAHPGQGAPGGRLAGNRPAKPGGGIPGGRGGADERVRRPHRRGGHAVGPGFRPRRSPGRRGPGRGHGDLRLPPRPGRWSTPGSPTAATWWWPTSASGRKRWPRWPRRRNCWTRPTWYGSCRSGRTTRTRAATATCWSWPGRGARPEPRCSAAGRPCGWAPAW